MLPHSPGHVGDAGVLVALRHMAPKPANQSNRFQGGPQTYTMADIQDRDGARLVRPDCWGGSLDYS